jgi:hypothetical protein
VTPHKLGIWAVEVWSTLACLVCNTCFAYNLWGVYITISTVGLAQAISEYIFKDNHIYNNI